MKIKNMTFGLLILLFGFTAHAGDNVKLAVKTQWCTNGQFKFVVQQSGPSLPAPVENCFTLGSSTLFSPQTINISESIAQPHGNVFMYMLREVLGGSSPNLSDYRQQEIVNYIVKQGRCGSNEFFVVERDSRFPYLPADNVNYARQQCSFYSAKRNLNSNLVLEGVYPNSSNQSIDDFASSLGR